MVTVGPPRTQAAGWLVLAALLVVAAVASDTAGTVLTLPAAAALATLGLRDLLLTPVLVADRHRVQVRYGLRRLTAVWDQVSLRVVTDRRSPLLEIDLGDTVVVLSRLRLGQPPTSVLTQLLALQG